MDAQTMYERGQPIDNHEEGVPAPAPGSPHFIIDEEGRKWYPFTVPHAAGFTIDYSLDPNPTAPAVDPAAPSTLILTLALTLSLTLTDGRHLLCHRVHLRLATPPVGQLRGAPKPSLSLSLTLR